MQPDTAKSSHRIETFFKVFSFALILLGVVVRLVVFFQNRDLFIDEANIARNIFERNFLQLAQPLSYQQYAPPVFLWILKLFTAFGGFSEQVLRIFPVLAGMGSLVMLYLVGKELKMNRSIWYPIGLMAVSFMMIRYSTEVKQYISDVLIVLGLLWLALRTPLAGASRKRFLLTWVIAGTVAIWSAMPSVFILAGVGCFYLVEAIKLKERGKLIPVLSVGVFWLLQFGIYYLVILKPQIESEYLQKFHKEYFLYAIPDNEHEWRLNWLLVRELIKETIGFYAPVTNTNLCLLFAGAILFMVKDTAKAMLVLVPFGAVLAAAALKQFSLIPRVSLFVMPCILLIICYAVDCLMRIRWKIVPALSFVAGCFAIYYFSMVRTLVTQPLHIEHITKGMDLVMEQPGIYASQLYVDDGARPAFIYYTRINPQKSRWGKLRDAHLLEWNSLYEPIAQAPDTAVAVLLTSTSPEALAHKRAIMQGQRKERILVDEVGSHAFIYSKP